MRVFFSTSVCNKNILNWIASGKKKKQQKNALLISEKKLTEYLLLLQELLKL